jgi:hypothetical protein
MAEFDVVFLIVGVAAITFCLPEVFFFFLILFERKKKPTFKNEKGWKGKIDDVAKISSSPFALRHFFALSPMTFTLKRLWD